MSSKPESSPQKEPVYEGIKQQLRAQIECGDLSVGARVASEHELARQFQVSRNQTRQALRELELEGYVIRRQGSGSFVAARNGEFKTIANTGAVVMIFPQYLSKYCHQVVEGFMRFMSEANQPTITYNWQKEGEEELRLLRTISESGAAGLVAWIEHDNEETRALVCDLQARRFPIVLVDRYLEGVDVDCVLSDNEEIGYRLTKALIEQEHRQIAFAGWFENAPSSLRNRLKGYRRALEEAGLPYEERLVGCALHELEQDGPAVIHQFMALANRPTAFVCVHDQIAKSLYDLLLDLGYRVPDDVTLAAVADGRPPARNDVPMITLQQQAHEIGACSAAILLDRVKHPDATYQHCTIQPTKAAEEIIPTPGRVNPARDMEG